MKKLTDDELEQVTGGFMNFHASSRVMDYTNNEGMTTYYQIIDFDSAWNMSQELHGQNIPEDDILARLIDAGYIC